MNGFEYIHCDECDTKFSWKPVGTPLNTQEKEKGFKCNDCITKAQRCNSCKQFRRHNMGYWDVKKTPPLYCSIGCQNNRT